MTIAQREPDNQHLLQDIEQISAAASHELRDQLREAMLYCDALRKAVGADAVPMLNHIEHCIESTMENVSALRQYAYLCQNSEQPKPVALDDVMMRAKALCRGSLPPGKGEVLWDPQAMPTVWGRMRQLELLFLHLFDNGLKYNQSTRPEVRVDVEDTGSFYRINVADNGVGMEEEYAFLVFGLFKRIDPHGPVKGCGAGLAVARKVAENHGGVLTLDTQPGYGCRFSFTLPKVAF